MLFILFNLLFKIIIIISFIVVFRIKKLIRLTKLKNPIGKKSHGRKNPMGTPTLLINFIVKKTRFLSENNQLLINDKTFIAYYVSK